MLFFQEDGLEGTFVIDLGLEIDNTSPIVSDEITDPKDLEFLSKATSEVEMADDGTYEEDEDSQDEEHDDDLSAHLANDPNDY